ncbi:MAG TPA: hypothetical protein VL309_03000 [Vicinamibacterales bacterium]|jgi:hypothetical protein|nr:hypothetical protein [Vicinamibacterales bacterium]
MDIRVTDKPVRRRPADTASPRSQRESSNSPVRSPVVVFLPPLSISSDQRRPEPDAMSAASSGSPTAGRVVADPHPTENDMPPLRRTVRIVAVALLVALMTPA